MLFRASTLCVHCQQGVTLGFWQLLPDPFRFQVTVNCRSCWHTNRLPWYLSFGIMMASVFATLFAMVVTGGLLTRYGLWPAPSGWRTLVGSAFAALVLSVIAVLFVRLWFAVARQPFVVPRDSRKGKG